VRAHRKADRVIIKDVNLWKRTATVGLTISLLIALVFMLASCRAGEPAAIGTTAPDFTVSDGQKSVTLSQLRGKPVLLNFWATWCPPCVEEVPSLVALQQQVGDKVTILAVSMDQDESAYKAFTAKNMPGMLTVRDPDHKSSSIYGTFAYPESFVIGRDGKIQRKFIGAVNWTSPEMIDFFSKL
jgi:cytochrome c biogenesis protein CcmG/thiol:disulfide interchange protein DsbE